MGHGKMERQLLQLYAQIIEKIKDGGKYVINNERNYQNKTDSNVVKNELIVMKIYDDVKLNSLVKITYRKKRVVIGRKGKRVKARLCEGMVMFANLNVRRRSLTTRQRKMVNKNGNSGKPILVEWKGEQEVLLPGKLNVRGRSLRHGKLVNTEGNSCKQWRKEQIVCKDEVYKKYGGKQLKEMVIIHEKWVKNSKIPV